MTDLKPQRPDPEDLSVSVRRGRASQAEERSLQRALTRDVSLRVAHQLGLDFDSDGSVHAGDEELILRAADAALARVAPAPVRRGSVVRRLAPLQHVAAIALLSSLCCSGVGAALWVAGVRPWRAFTAPETQPAPSQAPVRRGHGPRPQAKGAAASPEQLLAPAPEAAPAADRAPVRAPRALRSNDAAALFHAANGARRAGELAQARRLYSALIARAPDTDEAHLAHVSLGKLLLGQGEARAAERAFQRYLERGGGALSEEALFGRAQSLARLGRASEEAAAWRALRSAYPESVYAEKAQERLRVLQALDTKVTR